MRRASAVARGRALAWPSSPPAASCSTAAAAPRRHPAGPRPPARAARWRVLLLLDPAQAGLSGAREVEAFRALAPMPDTTAAHLCRLALMRLLPSLAEADLENFGAALTEIQAIVGDIRPRARQPLRQPSRRGGPGSADGGGCARRRPSSWGPTGFAFAPDEAAARAWREAVQSRARVWTSASAARSIEARR